MSRVLQLRTAEVFEPLLSPAPYKGAHGGRGSGKSHFFAEKLIEDCLAEPGEQGGEGMKAVCIREVQKDLAQSSKVLIESKLLKYGIGEADGFKVFREQIATPGDGVIIFKGMNDYTADSIKSLEGFKRSWWEEAHTATMHSINLLTPTLRRDGAERWFGWNPRRAQDAVELLLRGKEKPTDAVVVSANWRDNPFFPAELERERLDCKRLQPDQYGNIWEGEYVQVVSGAYFAAQLTEARAQKRIGRVSREPLMSVRAYCDLGGTGAKSDAFAIWIAQFVGREIRVLNYYEASGQPLATHLDWLRSQGYGPGKIEVILPHDGETHDRVIDVSFESAFKTAGYSTRVIANQGKGAAKARIEAARRRFPMIWFNEDTTEPGRAALGWYHEKIDEARGVGLGPEHDWASHGADAFGLMCIDYKEPGSVKAIDYSRFKALA